MSSAFFVNLIGRRFNKSLSHILGVGVVTSTVWRQTVEMDQRSERRFSLPIRPDSQIDYGLEKRLSIANKEYGVFGGLFLAIEYSQFHSERTRGA
jgi:hypothetical protein